MQDRLLFLISPPRAGSTLLQRMLGSHPAIHTSPEPHLITPLAYLGYHDGVDSAPYDHINAAEAMRGFVDALPNGEADYFDALRAYTDTLYGRALAPSGRRYYLDKTPAYALVLPFLTRLYPRARYVVLTRHPLAVMSSYANSFFGGDWEAALAYNPIVERYVPAMAGLLRAPTEQMLRVGYEQLVTAPEAELARVFSFLGVPDDPGAVDYGQRFAATPGRGDPITVGAQSRPVKDSLDKWVAELRGDERKLALARRIIDALGPDDVRAWGFERDALLDPLANDDTSSARYQPPRLNGHVLQRRVMLALKKDIDRRPHGKLIRRLRYYCNVLLRE